MTGLPTLGMAVEVSDNVLFQDLHGEGVLLNVQTGVYLGLDAIGTRAWQLLGKSAVLSELLTKILAEYDVPESRCSEDLLALVADLERHGLVTLSHPRGTR